MMTEKQQQTIKFALEQIAKDKHCVFYADPKTKVCVALRTTEHRDGSPKLSIGTSRCNAGEPFVKPIGLAIAMFRARGKNVPECLMKF